MAQLTYICRYFAFQIGALGMDTGYHRYGIWLGWKMKSGKLRRFETKWQNEWMLHIPGTGNLGY
jgi:hypothetical protein